MANKKWNKIGAVKRKSDDKPPYVVIDKNVEIRVDGVKLELGKYRTVKLINPSDRLEKMLENGSIDQATYEERLKQIQDNNVVYELTLPPSE